MTVGELKRDLEYFDDNTAICIAESSRSFVEVDVEIDDQELVYGPRGYRYKEPRVVAVISVCDTSHNTYYC